MARTFKSLLGDDIVNTRTLLHEAIPITGTISSGTYMVAGTGADSMTDANVKTFSHGMFQSVYDYPYLSSSANHIFDLTFGISTHVDTASITYAQASKKRNMYDQMAQVLMGYDVSGNIRNFDSDGEITTSATDSGLMNHCFFMNFSRLLSKDEIKKNSFRLQLFTSSSVSGSGAGRGKLETLGDYKSANEYRSSPAGDYGLLFTSSLGVAPASDVSNGDAVGVVFYQAGIAVITSSVIRANFSTPATTLTLAAAHRHWTSTGPADAGGGISHYQTGSTIDNIASAFRHCIYDIDFNNTIELNSAIYFCRVNHNEYNYSSNPTYVTGSKLRVKNNITDLPLSYITTVGLYSPDNELLAVAKLSEPIRKDPNTELTLRVRLDY